ncbi:MAG: hypothetical protein HY698_07830 [Deltaproteobacteria bacterium]|nr:hypothetical protein [Deltaproteobacteria bacterium]
MPGAPPIPLINPGTIMQQQARGLFVVLTVTACGLDPSLSPPDASAPDAKIAESSTCPGGIEPGPTGLTSRDLSREGLAGETEVKVVFCNPLFSAQPAHLMFYVTMSEHLAGIPPSDLSTSSWVETSRGATAKATLSWDGDDLTLGDHHVKGRLTGPRTTSAGVDLLGAGAAFLKLHVEGVGDNGPGVVMTWDEKFLP